MAEWSGGVWADVLHLVDPRRVGDRRSNRAGRMVQTVTDRLRFVVETALVLQAGVIRWHFGEAIICVTTKLFSELGLSSEVLKAIEKLGFEQAAPIQAAVIPVLLQGKDAVGQSQTGSGKTVAFAAPAIEKVVVEERTTQVLILRSEERRLWKERRSRWS